MSPTSDRDEAFDWRRLADGPRGRQLLLACAVAVERNRAAPDGGSSLGDVEFRLAVGEPGHVFLSASSGGPAQPLAPSTGRELRDALAAVTPGPVPPEEVPEVLEYVVGSARYWQAPERRDLVLGRPEQRELLLPWASQLGGDDSLGWWHSPIAREDQWLVSWENPSSPSDWSPEQMRSRLAEWARDERAVESRRAAQQSQAPREDRTGRWWTITGDVATTSRRWPGGRGVVVGWEGARPVRRQVEEPVGVLLVEDRCFPEESASWQRVVVPQDAKVLEVDDAQVWCDLCRHFPLEVTASRRDDWWRTTGRDGRWVIPDWSLVAQQWDAVHLPVAAYLELAGRVLGVDDGLGTMVAGWAPDSTRWLTGLPGLQAAAG